MKDIVIAFTGLLVAAATIPAAESKPVRVLIWDEQQPEQKQGYGDKFLGETIAAYLALLFFDPERCYSGISAKTAGKKDEGISYRTRNRTNENASMGASRSTESFVFA